MIVPEDGIPCPDHRAAGRPVKYPYRTMEVGQSFFCEGEGGRSGCQRHAKKTGKTFTARKWTEKGVHGYRIWRTA